MKKFNKLFVFTFVFTFMLCSLSFATEEITGNITITLDYQGIIDVITEMCKVGVPIGIIFGVVEWILYTLFNMAFPKRFMKD